MDKLVKKYISKSNLKILLYEGKNTDASSYVHNNIEAVNNFEESIWKIESLLNEYSTRYNLSYCKEVYFDIIEIDDITIKAIGFYNHCIIDIERGCILRLINNW